MSDAHYSLIIKDFRSQTLEIVGITTDHLKIEAVVCEMIDAGMNVFSDALAYPDYLREDILAAYRDRFHEEPGLFARLEAEYHERTQQHLHLA